MGLLAENEGLFGGFEFGNALFNGDAQEAAAFTSPVILLVDDRSFPASWIDNRSFEI